MDFPAIELSNNINLWIAYGLAFTLGLVVRDFITTIVQGALFKFNSSFNEGDEIILDGEDGYIVSIGWRYTRFAIWKDNEVLAWRYIPNDRIKDVKLERIVCGYDRDKWDDRRHKNEFIKKNEIQKLNNCEEI